MLIDAFDCSYSLTDRFPFDLFNLDNIIYARIVWELVLNFVNIIKTVRLEKILIPINLLVYPIKSVLEILQIILLHLHYQVFEDLTNVKLFRVENREPKIFHFQEGERLYFSNWDPTSIGSLANIKLISVSIQETFLYCYERLSLMVSLFWGQAPRKMNSLSLSESGAPSQ